MSNIINFTDDEINEIQRQYYEDNLRQRDIAKNLGVNVKTIQKVFFQRGLISRYPNEINLIGKKFERLLVIELNGVNRFGKKLWKCLCDCGNYTVVPTGSLTSRQTKSCGCLNNELLSTMGERSKGFNSLPFGEAAQRLVIGTYKRSAKNREIKFDLSNDEMMNLFSGNCHYCNKPPSNIKELNSGYFIYNGIDRKNSSKGYTTENCVSCCMECNYSKMDRTDKEFLNWIKAVYDNFMENKVVEGR